MNLHIARGTTLSATNPLLDTFISDAGGFLVEPQSLAFAIYDLSSDAKKNNPVTVVARTDIDLTADKIHTGHYAAPCTILGNVAPGTYMIEWFCVLTDGAAEIAWTRTFEIVVSNAIVPRGKRIYATISDVRAEGIGPMISDARILMVLAACSEQLEKWTGRRFVPEYKQTHLDTATLRSVYLDEPIVAIESFSILEPSWLFARSAYKVYNRHLRENLGNPDDRRNPHIDFAMASLPQAYTTVEYLSPPIFPTFGLSQFRFSNQKTPQRLVLVGVFGYTDYDGSFEGSTPYLVRQIVTRMALRDLYPQASQQAQMFRDQIYTNSLRTREQSIGYDRPKPGAGTRSTKYTGDPDIDSKIQSFVRGARVTVV